MADDTIWERKQHTEAKHRLLRLYLDAWLPVMSRNHDRVAFIDGFAGPGQYAGGEPGSPIIAIQAAKEHRSNLSGKDLRFRFVEERPDRAANLENLLQRMRADGDLPEYITTTVIPETFESAMNRILSRGEGRQMVPAFVMIDPFGVKGVPFSVLEGLGGQRYAEVMVSFMNEPIERFLGHPSFESHLDNLYGCRDWRNAEGLRGEERQAFLVGLYVDQLKNAGFPYARSFRMIDNRNKTPYHLVYGTHHPKGLEVMKDAMWKVDPTGSYAFVSGTHPAQLTMFASIANFALLKEQVHSFLAEGPKHITAVEEFVVTETDFRKAHLRNHALKPLEDEGRITVVGRRRGRTYPRGCVIKRLA